VENAMKKIKVGLVGLNFGARVAENQIRSGLGEPYFELASVCDLDRAKCDRAAERYGVKACYAIDDLLADDDIPVIIDIAGPNGRGERITHMVEAGKHVMTTKPFELDSNQAEKALGRARELGRVVHLNSPCASLSDDFRQIEAWQEKYDLGRIIAARHECWYKNVEKADGGWYDDPEQCPAAPIFRLGIYGINDMLQLMGEPESVQVTQSRIFTGRPTPDIAMMTMRFKNGCIAETMDGWCLQPARGAESLVLYFEGGTIHRNPVLVGGLGFESGPSKLCVVPASSENGAAVEEAMFDRQQLSHCYQWDVFYKAIQGEPIENATPDSVIVDGIRVIEAMKRAQLSGRTEAV
jgi:predicted dehydrogenase